MPVTTRNVIPFITRAALCAVIAAASCSIAFTQEKDSDSLRLNTTLVQVPVVVTDRKGMFVSDLEQSNFTVSEDNRQQEIALFTARKAPFNVVLLLDTSNSTEDRLRAIQLTAATFVHELRPEDRAMVISFDNEIHQLTDFTSDQTELVKAIKSTESGFGKLLYEGVQRALDQLKEVEGRRAVILFSDGVDMRSIDASSESTLRSAESIGAVIYSIQFNTRWWIEAEARKQAAAHPGSKSTYSGDIRIPPPPPSDSPRRPRIEMNGDIGIGLSRGESSDDIGRNLDKLYGEASDYMKTLAAQTGGQVYQAEDFDQSREAYARIAEELRNQYLIGYYTGSEHKDGKYHRIRVAVRQKDLVVRARPGYRAAKAGD